MNSKIAFVILNYKNCTDTIQCIESISNLSITDKLIVIVDNGSKDGSTDTLNELFGKVKDIVIIPLEENVGFSRGNNAGYKYVREHYDADFVVITNNDVLFPQSDFSARLQKIYEETRFMVYGPDIFVRKTGEHQSPMYLELPSVDTLEKELDMYRYYEDKPKKWVNRRKIQIVKNRQCCKSTFFNTIYSIIKNSHAIYKNNRHQDCCLQGACLIVSKEYLEKEEKMFSPEPFLYCEELLLYMRCISKKYKTVYDPSIIIFHEDSSTVKKITGNAIEKAKFTLPYHVESLNIVIQYLNRITDGR